MGARLMEVRGRVEYDDEVIHVIASHMTDATHQLHRLSDDMLTPQLARADHVNHPLPAKLNQREDGEDSPPGNRECGWHDPSSRGHPRDVRIIPKSRDFH